MAVEENVQIQGKLTLDKKALKANLKTALGDFRKMAGQISSIFKGISIIAFLKEGFETAVEMEQTGIRINTILRNRYGLEKGISNELESQAEAISKNSIFRKNEIQSAQEALLLNLESTSGIEAATKAAELYTLALEGASANSSALAKNAEKMAQAIRYGNFAQFENLYSGEVGITQEQIAYLAQFSTEAERANALLKVMNENFGQTKEDVDNSFAGSFKKAMATLKDFAVMVAQTLVPVFSKIFDIINSLSEAFGGLENVMIGFMLFMLTKMVVGFISTTLPGLLGMGIAQAFAQGGPVAALAAVGIAGAIAAAVGAAVAGIVMLKTSLKKSQKTNVENKQALKTANAAQNQYNPVINLEANIKTDPIKGTVSTIKRVGDTNTKRRYV